MPMSSRSLPDRKTGDRVGERFVGERREFFRPGMSKRGRFGVVPPVREAGAWRHRTSSEEVVVVVSHG